MSNIEGKHLSPDMQDAASRSRRVMFSDQLGTTEANNNNNNNNNNLSPREKTVADERHPPPKKEVMMNTTNNQQQHQKNNKKNVNNQNQNNHNNHNNRNAGSPPAAPAAPTAPAAIGEAMAHVPAPTSFPPPAAPEKRPEGLEERPEDRGGRRQRVRRPMAPQIVPQDLLEMDPVEEARKSLQEAAGLLEAQERADRVRVEVQHEKAHSGMYGEMRATCMSQKAKAKSPQKQQSNEENDKNKNNEADHSDVNVKADPNVQHLQGKSETAQIRLTVNDVRTSPAKSVPPPSEAATKEEKEGEPKVPSANVIIQWMLRLLQSFPGDGIVWKVLLLFAALLCSRRLLLLLQR
ncbi:uncharacterized protein TM35_000261380 [Trypanosoma theileri]|uniref:Uncharacterized protein n=1 Tax=Trypanosoma theileri TaxID=67003 RepID=A0A1X0NPQ1_9TRYP|nr:uncharacterized protein TM35_000261380 [Trypanosoma theileri]ORC86686.1 hypothetical protein TM35_000261380 [Trypanosoma theileri]